MIRVVVADDHQIFLQGLVQLLSTAEGVDVVGVAGGGAEALDLTEFLHPQVLILDLSMSEVDGFEVLRQLRARARGAPTRVLILTMHKDPVSLKLALDLGADGYILKEEAFRVLTEAIEALSRGKRYLSPKVTDLLEEIRRGHGEASLSPRERQVVALIAGDCTTREIAQQLGISVKTVETHRQHIMAKLGFTKVTQIVSYALRVGITE